MSSNHLILCHPLLLLPSIFPSIRVFSNESILHIRWPKYWSFSFSISPSNEYSGLISFRIDWLNLLAVQGTLCTRSGAKLSEKLTFFSPVATAEFSKFAGIWSAALSQPYLLGFEIALLEFHHLH